MSLAPGEQRALAEIESRIRRSDPSLAALFTLLSGADARKRPGCEFPPRRSPELRGRTRALFLLVASATLLVACIAMTMAAVSREVPAGDGHGSGVRPAGAYLPGSQAP
jgi:hypothetical protein